MQELNADEHTAHPLGRIPAGYTETRSALHRLAVYVVSPARRRVTGRIGLRWTPGGFGTPLFGANEQVRIDGTDLVRQRGDRACSQPVTSLDEAAAFILDGPPDTEWATSLDVPALGSTDDELMVEPAAARLLADWYAFTWSVLEGLHTDAESVDPSPVQLWPEHFDAAFDCLPVDRRATLGASPGDRFSAEPYLYVISPAVDARNSLWNASSFAGAILPFSELVDSTDQRATALEFFRSRRAALDEIPDPGDRHA